MSNAVRPDPRARAVLRVLAGEAAAAVAVDEGVPLASLIEWKRAFVDAGGNALDAASRPFGLAQLCGADEPDFRRLRWPHEPSVFHGPLDRLPLPAQLYDIEALLRLPNVKRAVFGAGGFRAAIAKGQDAVAYFHRGDTVYLMGIQDAVPGLKALCRQLAHDVGVETEHVSVEAFVSSARGSSVHYDFDVNFNVQLIGSKSWRLAANAQVENPTASLHPEAGKPLRHPFDGTELDAAFSAGAMNVRAEPGTVVFLPRGAWHETTLGDVPSLAIAFAIRTPTLAHVLTAEMLGILLRRPELRGYLIGPLTSEKLVLAKEIFRDLLDELDPAEVGFNLVRLCWLEGSRRTLLGPVGGWRVQVTATEQEFDVAVPLPLVGLAEWVSSAEDFTVEEAITSGPPQAVRHWLRGLLGRGLLSRV
jgi:hypothetical protein